MNNEESSDFEILYESLDIHNSSERIHLGIHEENQDIDEEIEEDIDEEEDIDDEEALGEQVLQTCTSSAFATTLVSALSIQTPAAEPDNNSIPERQIDESLRSILGDIEIPDGVDPSFLAALPDEMRAEVVSEHIRMQNSRQRSVINNVTQPNNPPEAIVEVNPEFLAALPPNIQEEVLAQQRLELQRQAAQAINPNEPVNAAEFFQNLSANLRQSVCTCNFEIYILVI